MSPSETDSEKPEKSADAFRTITEVADLLDVQQHVLRFWETKFSQIKPMKRAGGRRYYRPDDVRLLEAIRILLHDEGYTIRGVQKLLRETGVKAVLDSAAAAYAKGQSGSAEPPNPVEGAPEKGGNPVQPSLDIYAPEKAAASKDPEADALKAALRDLRAALDDIRQLLPEAHG